MFEHIIGHTNITTMLQRHIDTEALQHAYIFAGPAHSGKKTVAQAFVKQLIQQPYDYMQVSPLPDAERITISQINDVRQFAAIKTTPHQYRVIQINGIDTLNSEAANRFLKILEEPPRGIIFIGITQSLESVLPTIRSRCSIVRFTPVSETVLRSYILDTYGVVHDEYADMIKLAQGAPGILKTYIEQPAVLQEKKEQMAWFQRLMTQRKIIDVQQLESFGLGRGAYIERKERFADLQRLLHEWLHGILQKNASDVSAQIVALYQASIATNKQLAFNPDITTRVYRLMLTR